MRRHETRLQKMIIENEKRSSLDGCSTSPYALKNRAWVPYVTRGSQMAPAGFRGLSVVAVSLFSFVGFLTLVGFLYEKFTRASTSEREDEKRLEISQEDDGELRAERSSVGSGQNSLNNLQGELNASQIAYLLDSLDKADEELLETILVSLSNCCAFTTNQNLVRENGGIGRIIKLVQHGNDQVRIRAVQTLSNLSMNLENQVYIKECIPNVLSKISPEQSQSTGDNELIAILQLLVNLTVVDTWHAVSVDSIAYCLCILEQEALSMKVKTNALRLLVNFSCNAENADLFFKEKMLEAFGNFLTNPVSEDNVLRSITIIANTVKFGCSKTAGHILEVEWIEYFNVDLSFQ